MARESKFTKDELYNVTHQLLLQYGYAGFHFGLLADQLHVSRGALYKYFTNKDELITEFMSYKMDQILNELKNIHHYKTFTDQFHYLIHVIFKYSNIHQMLSLIFQIPKGNQTKVSKTLTLLEKQHREMHSYLADFIQLGRKENLLNPNLPDDLLLDFIFQTVNIPNNAHFPEKHWKEMIITLLSNGIFTTN